MKDVERAVRAGAMCPLDKQKKVAEYLAEPGAAVHLGQILDGVPVSEWSDRILRQVEGVELFRRLRKA